MSKASLISLLLCAFVVVSGTASSQAISVSADPPVFDAATIKPPNPTARFQKAGFYGEAGGRVFLGVNLMMLVQYAFDLQEYQILGGAEWTVSQRFEINAVPPEASLSRKIRGHNAEPSPEQRLMLQSLLRDRFGFKFHLDTKEEDVYLLTRGTKPLQLKPSKDPTVDPRAVVMMKQSGIADGEAVGINMTTDYLAVRLSRYLQHPVLNGTGITGSYDYDLPPNDPENEDIAAAVFSVVDRLGLKIKRGRGTVSTLVIDHVEKPSEN